MAVKVIMPKLGLTMVDGTILKWLKNEGEKVEKGEPLVEVQSDKSSFEVESSASGVLRKILAVEGAVVPITYNIAIIAGAEEDISSLIGDTSSLSGCQLCVSDPSQGCGICDTSNKTSAAGENKGGKALGEHQSQKVKISPRAKKLALSRNVDWAQIKGSGPEGRIVEKDVQLYIEQFIGLKATPLTLKVAQEKNIDLATVGGSGVSGRIFRVDLESSIAKTAVTVEAHQTQTGPREKIKTIPYKGMRKVIGDRLSQSKFTAPHVYFTVAIDMSRVQDLRDVLDKKKVSVSYNDIFVYVVSRALRKHPLLNSSLVNNEIIFHEDVNMGIAVALPEGLIVPVIRCAQEKSLEEIALQSKNLVDKARKGMLSPDEYKGGTFTISNLGMVKVDNFTAIINPPEAAILAVSRIIKTPMVNEETNAIEVKPILNITVSVDHRIIDGFEAAQFLQTVKTYLEEPYYLL